MLGIGLAAFLYLGERREVEGFAQWLWPLRDVSFHKFYVDQLYQFIVVWPLQLVGLVSYALDRVLIDGAVNLAGRLPVQLGATLRRMQSGLVPFYGMMMAIGAVLILGLGGLFWFGG